MKEQIKNEENSHKYAIEDRSLETIQPKQKRFKNMEGKYVGALRPGTKSSTV